MSNNKFELVTFIIFYDWFIPVQITTTMINMMPKKENQHWRYC
ncbi:hypothetical protein CPS_1227 [Colwellia psychrerythraea 34H]|uniref:Uncharacterized protein n=1 Tax=Colwellia psychrerythraea (strain 34H / ATCC BAA-681) TaxID=167879 RepID=Q486P5_COLP3|nr:hypothetical protein CPS_1227 [Colwellia psychrerythraea 34H]